MVGTLLLAQIIFLYTFYDYQLNVCYIKLIFFILHTVYFLVYDIMYKKDEVRFTNSKNYNRGNIRFMMR